MMRWTVLALLLLLTCPAWARVAAAWPGSTVRCLTYEDKAIGLWQTLCDDGRRAVTAYNRTLARWETLVWPPPGKTCMGPVNSGTGPVEGRCR
jgi:hypothetical protein